MVMGSTEACGQTWCWGRSWKFHILTKGSGCATLDILRAYVTSNPTSTVTYSSNKAIPLTSVTPYGLSLQTHESMGAIGLQTATATKVFTKELSLFGNGSNSSQQRPDENLKLRISHYPWPSVSAWLRRKSPPDTTVTAPGIIHLQSALVFSSDLLQVFS